MTKVLLQSMLKSVAISFGVHLGISKVLLFHC